MGLLHTEPGKQTATSHAIQQPSLLGLPVLAPGSLHNGDKVEAVQRGILTRFVTITHMGSGETTKC